MGSEASRAFVVSPAPLAADSPLTEAAFTDALLQHQWPLYAFLRGFVLNDEQARDLTQDVFCDAWRARQRAAAPFVTSRHAPLPDAEGIRRWLFHTAYHRAISARRRMRLIRWESLDARVEGRAGGAPSLASAAVVGVRTDPFVEPFTDSFEDQVIEGQALRAALAKLDAVDVATLLLSIVHGFTTAEIAQVIGATPDAAKKRLSRARQRLRASYLAQNRQSAQHMQNTLTDEQRNQRDQREQTGKERRA